MLPDFEDIYEQYREPILSLVKSCTGRGERGLDVQQLFSAGTLSLWMASESYQEGRGNFRGYALQAIRWAIIDEMRHQESRQYFPLMPNFDVFVDRIRDDCPNQEEASLTGEMVVALWAAIGRLPLRMRLAVVEVFLHERKRQDVAADLGVTPQRVTQLLRKAFIRLRADLAYLN